MEYRDKKTPLRNNIQKYQQFTAQLYMNGAGQVGGENVFFKRNPGAGGIVAWGGRADHSMPDHDKYQLRPRAARCREPRARRSPQPLSKYRRKTANARERSRMREINRAFETLRQAVPASAITGTPVPCEKLTKITTLRLAMRYITALSTALRETSPEREARPERWPSPLCSDMSEFSTELDQETPSEFAEDSLSPFDSFFAEFDCEYIDRTFA